MPGTTTERRPKTEKEVILQRITALERLAKVGAIASDGPKYTEIAAWVKEVKEYVKRA